MKEDVLGLNHRLSFSATCQTVRPRSSARSSGHRRIAPPKSSSAMPRCFRYHAASAAPSPLLLKKTPPTPVILAIVALLHVWSSNESRMPRGAAAATGRQLQALVRLPSSRYFTYTVLVGPVGPNCVIPSLPAIARAASLSLSMLAMTRCSLAVLNAQLSTSWQACLASPCCCASDRIATSSSKSSPPAAWD